MSKFVRKYPFRDVSKQSVPEGGLHFLAQRSGEQDVMEGSSVMDERMPFVVRLREGEVMGFSVSGIRHSRNTGYKVFRSVTCSADSKG